MKISELFTKYGSDKNRGTLPSKDGHFYGSTYDNIFESFDKDSTLNILEIGVQKGGCLKSMREYFPNSKLYGVDIVDVVLDEYRSDDITYIFSDIKSDISKSALDGISFDIIIDDGSHFIEDVLHVVNNYTKSLNSGGYLIVEDCQQPEEWYNTIKGLITDDFTISLEDFRGVNGYCDDCLIVIRKK